eukprot:GHVT01066106.1.p1 GENE.GHVT01066106.1~~GHVT01066106.1.p1  ORF type:complete len:108 (-),score=2.07 GHVT01066106.1:361-684(-)
MSASGPCVTAVTMAQLPWEAKWRILQYNTIPNHVIKLEDMTEDAVDYDSWEGAKITIKPPKLSVLNGAYTINGTLNVYKIHLHGIIKYLPSKYARAIKMAQTTMFCC